MPLLAAALRAAAAVGLLLLLLLAMLLPAVLAALGVGAPAWLCCVAVRRLLQSTAAAPLVTCEVLPSSSSSLW